MTFQSTGNSNNNMRDSLAKYEQCNHPSSDYTHDYNLQPHKDAEETTPNKRGGQLEWEAKRVKTGYTRYTAAWSNNTSIVVHCDSTVMDLCEGAEDREGTARSTELGSSEVCRGFQLLLEGMDILNSWSGVHSEQIDRDGYEVETEAIIGQKRKACWDMNNGTKVEPKRRKIAESPPAAPAAATKTATNVERVTTRRSTRVSGRRVASVDPTRRKRVTWTSKEDAIISKALEELKDVNVRKRNAVIRERLCSDKTAAQIRTRIMTLRRASHRASRK